MGKHCNTYTMIIVFQYYILMAHNYETYCTQTHASFRKLGITGHTVVLFQTDAAHFYTERGGPVLVLRGDRSVRR